MSISRYGRSRQGVMAAIIGVGVATMMLFILLHGVNKLLLDDSEVLAFDRDYSVSALWVVILFALAAVAWWRLRVQRPAHGWVWAAMAVLCAALAVESIVQVHKDLERSLGFEVNVLVIQPVLAIVVVGLFVLCARRLPSPERLLVVGAAIALVLAQFFSIVNGQYDLPYAGIILAQTLEEAMEMLTAILLLAAPAGLALGLPLRAAQQHGTTPAPAPPRARVHSS